MDRSELNTGMFILSLFLVLFINNWIIRALFGSDVNDYLIGMYIVVFVELGIFLAARLFLNMKKK